MIQSVKGLWYIYKYRYKQFNTVILHHKMNLQLPSSEKYFFSEEKINNVVLTKWYISIRSSELYTATLKEINI